ELSRYVHLNPVRVAELGLDKESRRRQRLGVDEKPEPVEVRERIEQLRSYRWSSYRAYVGLDREARWLEVKTVVRGVGKGSRVGEIRSGWTKGSRVRSGRNSGHGIGTGGGIWRSIWDGNYCGLKLKELGERVGGLDYRSVSWAVDRLVKRAAKEKELRAVLAM